MLRVNMRKLIGVDSLEDAKAVAIRHYKALMENDYETWRETLVDYIKEKADVKGSSAYFWWTTGRKYVEKYGVYYTFYREASVDDPNRRKFFFKRKNPDGTDRGMPVPIVLVKENDQWKVESASY